MVSSLGDESGALMEQSLHGERDLFLYSLPSPGSFKLCRSAVAGGGLLVSDNNELRVLEDHFFLLGD